MRRNKGIICIETEWEITEKGNRLPLNSEPLLEFISKSMDVPYIYRRVATIEELKYYFKKFHEKQYVNNYNIFYFSFHGNTHLISFESGYFLDLPTLADLSKEENGESIFKDKYVHFGSCRTMHGSETFLKNFIEKTGAKMVSGFTKGVKPFPSAIHDAALIKEMLTCSQTRAVINHMNKYYEGLQEELGFRYYY